MEADAPVLGAHIEMKAIEVLATRTAYQCEAITELTASLREDLNQ